MWNRIWGLPVWHNMHHPSRKVSKPERSRCSIDVSALKREQHKLHIENGELKEMLRDYFKTLAGSEQLRRLITICYLKLYWNSNRIEESILSPFTFISVSKDLAQLGLLSVQKKEKPVLSKKTTKRRRPKSSPHGEIVLSNVGNEDKSELRLMWCRMNLL